MSNGIDPATIAAAQAAGCRSLRVEVDGAKYVFDFARKAVPAAAVKTPIVTSSSSTFDLAAFLVALRCRLMELKMLPTDKERFVPVEVVVGVWRAMHPKTDDHKIWIMRNVLKAVTDAKLGIRSARINGGKTRGLKIRPEAFD